MIRLIVGLGNPGAQYQTTRHNAGFLFLDELIAKFGGFWSQQSKFEAELTECLIGAEKIMLLKPQTYMNKSGGSVGKVMRYYKMMPDQLLVVHDELDFAPGIIKLKKGGGHAGHNGLRDIVAHLGSADFYRLRIGIGRSSDNIAAFVLSKPCDTEWGQISKAMQQGMSCIGDIVAGNINTATNCLNSGLVK